MPGLQHNALDFCGKGLLSLSGLFLFLSREGSEFLVCQWLTIFLWNGEYFKRILFEQELFAVRLFHQLLLQFGLSRFKSVMELLPALGIVIVFKRNYQGMNGRADQLLHVFAEDRGSAGGELQISGLIWIVETMQIALIFRNGFPGSQPRDERFYCRQFTRTLFSRNVDVETIRMQSQSQCQGFPRSFLSEDRDIGIRTGRLVHVR